MNAQALSTQSSFYLCHLHQLKNSKDLFLQGYNIINGGNTGHVHHLLLYECSIKDNLIYSGLCGIYNARLMPSSVYRYCQTRIIIAWARGGQLNYDYPTKTGLKMLSSTQLLFEVHFEPSIPRNHSIGIQLRFYPLNEKPQYEVGVLTLGTLANSPLFLPPSLNTISFPTYCFNDCLKSFLKNNLVINIFSILVHAHQRATRIILEKNNNFSRLIDQNPFKFHQQEMIYFHEPYPQINSANELSLICYYSTQNDHLKGIYGGYDSNNEMCQAFIYYYPKVESFPLCLSLPVYKNKHLMNNKRNWTNKLSLYIKDELESNIDHLSLCGDNIYFNQSNKTMLQTKLYQRSMKNFQQYSYVYLHFSSIFYTTITSILLISIIYCYLIIKKFLHSFFNGSTL
ncbi:unnamed protein product [Rotaria magnacalcarata]|uniref:Uncharacterized protein n=2 Tax=Rotaria magnacalcarata TaxID=392030 RepID=A0A816W5K3_9BILA|nr:unnamed protein product [Rotaria magnacalcarata]CAF2131821.1 unnamed protein product [Rotaria magnacalcarata]